MSMSWKKFYSILVLSLLLTNCGKEEFSAKKKQDQSNVNTIKHFSQSDCLRGETPVKPKVDFLFLWDNTSSQNHVTDEVKTTLNNTINQLALGQFNYHILLAPLVGNGLQSSYLVAESPEGLSSNVTNNYLVLQSSAAQLLGTFSQAGPNENGIDRAYQLLRDNTSNGIFRRDAYLIVVLMSNGDYTKTYSDTGIGTDMAATDRYIQEQIPKWNYLKSTLLNNTYMRFISFVPHSKCHKYYRANYTYRKFSKLIQNMGGSGAGGEDSFDMCKDSFSNVFQSINESIKPIMLKHKYNYWPISKSSKLSFNPAKITLQNTTTGKSYTGLSGGNGFQYVGYQTVNRRFYPSSGSPYTGHVVKLFGDAVVTHPECLLVKTQSPYEYYGYVHLHSKPLVSSIRLKINGIEVKQSSSDGWTYMTGGSKKQNLKILGPQNPSRFWDGDPDPVYKTGYFLKLSPNKIYTNGATLSVTYDPVGN